MELNRHVDVIKGFWNRRKFHRVYAFLPAVTSK